MKIAIFHTAIDNIGGAEMVCLTLARELGAHLYTTNIDHEKIKKMGFENVPIFSVGKIPNNAPFRQQLALFLFDRLNLGRRYDYYIIGGDWAVSVAEHHKPNLWYVHSPIREIWDLYEYTREHSVPSLLRPCFDVWVKYNRQLNRRYVQHVDKIACNSINTKNRLKKFLERDAQVIYPPVDTAQFSYKKNGDFWLSVNRLITHKRIDVQLEAFRKLPHEKLLIVGSYEQSRHFKSYAKYIQDTKPSNVEVLSWVSADQLRELYADCKGFITTAKDEDFGLTAIEAMAAGKPVIAPNEGGYKETIVDGQTGILMKDVSEQSLRESIHNVLPLMDSRQACRERALEFDTNVFIKKIKHALGTV